MQVDHKGNQTSITMSEGRSVKQARCHTQFAAMHVVLDAILPFLTTLSNFLVFLEFLRSRCLLLAGMMILCMLGPHIAVTYVQTVRSWMSQLHSGSSMSTAEPDKGVWTIPQCLVSKLHNGQLNSTKQMKGTAGISLRSLEWSMKLVLCTLWAIPVVVPHLLIQDFLAEVTILYHRLRRAVNFIRAQVPCCARDRNGRVSGGTESYENKVKDAEGWLFKRRILDLFFHSYPQIAVHLATLTALYGQHLIWGTWPRIIWMASILLGVCCLFSNMILVMGFTWSTGMKVGEVIWFATDNPGVVTRLSDIIVFLYRDECECLEIDVDDDKFQEIWSALLQILQKDMVNLSVVRVVAKGGEATGEIKKGLKDLFKIVQGKPKSNVKEILVDLSVLGGMVQV